MTVRWDDATYEYVRQEAKHAGTTVAQFVREATLIRAVIRSAERDAPGVSRDFRELAREVERMSAVRGVDPGK